MTNHASNYQGLSDEEVRESRALHGTNQYSENKKNNIILALFSLLKEPMFILLMVASIIYFLIGQPDDGAFMIAAIMLVSAISLYQDSRSRIALESLRKLTRPLSKLIRGGKEVQLPIEEIVIGDYMIIEEGSMVPADGEILQSNDFEVNESILTGESFAVAKSQSERIVYQGTQVTAGLAICRVIAIGSYTRLGKIGKSIEEIETTESPLQTQINSFVRFMALAGLIIFLLVWLLNFFQSGNWMNSLLKSLTLAMSILPEEIPVAFTTFMALGAWRLMKLGIVVKQTRTVETLGSATVICVDKTGTITENKMNIGKLYCVASDDVTPYSSIKNEHEKDLIATAMWASEPVPFDPMEQAIHLTYSLHVEKDQRPQFNMVKEYPLSGKPPMMTHVFENALGNRVIAAKGAPEALLKLSHLSEEKRKRIALVFSEFSSEGYRVLAIGKAIFAGSDFPLKQEQFQFQFLGLIGFYDPPKQNIANVFKAFYQAGIKIKILTGDNAVTTATIARQVGFKHDEKVITGEEIMSLSDIQLKEKTRELSIFARVFPEAKLRIIQALKASGEVVAMTGDGVNDGPALRAAHIGIAMGSKGAEIAKQASSLVLVDDDLARMVDAIAMGRKIYTNLKKAIQYIISIHIPIILTVFLPLLLGWAYPTIFSPIHIIFLELIMGPTCSILYENEPLEKNVMSQNPRPYSSTFFNLKELTTSIIQGVIITIGTLAVYQYALQKYQHEEIIRTMVFLTLISANIFLTLVNRSFHYSIITTLFYKNGLVPLIVLLTLALTSLILFVKPFSHFFEFDQLNGEQILISLSAGFFSVIWFEIVKWVRRQYV